MGSNRRATGIRLIFWAAAVGVVWLLLQFGTGGGWGLMPGSGPGEGGDGDGAATTTSDDESSEDESGKDEQADPDAGEDQGTGEDSGENITQQIVRVTGDTLVLNGEPIEGVEAFRLAVVALKDRDPSSHFIIIPEEDVRFGQVQELTDILDRHQFDWITKDPTKDQD